MNSPTPKSEDTAASPGRFHDVLALYAPVRNARSGEEIDAGLAGVVDGLRRMKRESPTDPAVRLHLALRLRRKDPLEAMVHVLAGLLAHPEDRSIREFALGTLAEREPETARLVRSPKISVR